MFLHAALARNRRLVDHAIDAVRSGAIRPGTFVVDVDSVVANAELLRDAAAAVDLRLHFMTKQIGRQPAVIRAVAGVIPTAVAVNLDDADALARAGVRIGNAGHLVQPSLRRIGELLDLAPELVTVYGVETALAIDAEAGRRGMSQPLLLRVVGPEDHFPPGQDGGLPLEDFDAACDLLRMCQNIRIAGVTTYPALQVEPDGIRPTPNMLTAVEAGRRLGAGAIVNAPGHTSVSSLPLLRDAGATEAEPGHALTGTTPLHAEGSEPETLAIVFATEVSHRLSADSVAVFGGGFYARGHATNALVASPSGEFEAPLQTPPPEAIDYYAVVRDGGRAGVGDPVVCAFRFQVFVTRAPVAAVVGIGGRPSIASISDPSGHEVRR